VKQSSETIGRIAAALALAQRQLENPEKTLTASIASPFPREGSVSFRYASLATGLDLIRKALGEQEIAAIQRTEIDKEMGFIKLNTVLAHSSGEWISSDWPVCQTSEVGAPHRLGAALTYARRYALFALVGITGEDDLDAPDLAIAPSSLQKASEAIDVASKGRAPKRDQLLSISDSQEARDQLVGEVQMLVSADDLTLWALRRLPLKNKLQDGDAEAIEAAYRAKLDAASATRGDVSEGETALSDQPPHLSGPAPSGDEAIYKQPKTLRRRNKAHLSFVASQPCLVCQRTPSDAHHLKFAQPQAMGRKVSDEFTVPLCRDHHTQLHAQGNEKTWWFDLGIAPLNHAQELWNVSLRACPARTRNPS
jgi:ERF superfamily